MSSLRSILYVSLATHELTTDELEALLASARAFNLEHGLSGVLLHSGRHFMQCIEGAPADVQEAYERIKRSSLHQDLVAYMDGPVPRRSFASWTTGIAHPTESDLLTLATTAWATSSRQPFSAESPTGLEMLKVFWSLRH